jgi:hypothetical protein
MFFDWHEQGRTTDGGFTVLANKVRSETKETRRSTEHGAEDELCRAAASAR